MYQVVLFYLFCKQAYYSDKRFPDGCVAGYTLLRVCVFSYTRLDRIEIPALFGEGGCYCIYICGVMWPQYSSCTIKGAFQGACDARTVACHTFVSLYYL